MKKITLFLITIIYVTALNSQQTPVNENIKQTRPPDLEITGIQLIEASKDAASGLHTIKVSVGIRNNGNTTSGSSSVKATVHNPASGSTATLGSTKNTWMNFGKTLPVNGIAAGRSVQLEFVFKEDKKTIAGDRCMLKVMINPASQLKETNLDNNYSTAIEVVPTVATVQMVAAERTVNVTNQLVKPDTLVYTIGRADFRLSNEGGTGEYTKIFPQGLTLKKTGAWQEKINNSLIAPLHLPVGAVIRKVVLNYIVLPQSGAVPHLVLRSNTLGADGGWGLNKAITSYWVTSNDLNARNGYDVKSSSSAAGFNLPINKESTYYFEILAGDSRSTATPTSSAWPDNEKIFIWGISVHYTL